MRRQQAFLRILLSCGVLLFLGYAGLGLAQVGTTSLSGTVVDSTGGVVPNAQVTLTSVTMGFARTNTTNNAGAYLFPDLTPGVYDVAVEASGFKTANVKALKLFVGQPVVQDFRLEVGSVAQSVTVEGTSPLLNQTDATVGTVLESKLITTLPLNGRNFLELPRLSPGVSYDKNSNTMDDVQINPTARSFNVNGHRGDYNSFTLDGTLISEYQHGSNTFSPSVDAVEEFQLASSNYSAAEGTEAAAHVNLVTKSGTNNFHGDVYEFLRNDKLDARDFFSPDLLPFRRNQFGATAGGPFTIPKVYNGKDRSFFFASYEGFRESRGSPLLGYYPTPEQIAGDLSTLATAENPVIDPQTGEPFAGNIIPQDRMPANLLHFLQNGIGNGPWIPAPNYSTTPGYNFFRPDTRGFTNNQVMVRFDQEVGSKTFLYGRYAFNKGALRNPNLNPNWNYTQENRAHSVAFHLASPLKSNLLWEITFGWSRFYQNEYYSTAFKNNVVQELGIQGVHGADVPETWGAPTWDVSGYSTMGEVGSAPRKWTPDIIEFHPALSWIKGKHSMRFGVDIYRGYNSFPEWILPGGYYSFSGEYTGYPLADFLLGLPVAYEYFGGGFDPKFRYTMLQGYFQDDWKVTPRLTLNLGLRYEANGIPYSSNRSASNLYLGPDNADPQLYVSQGYGAINFLGYQQELLTGVPFVTANTLGLPNYLIRRENKNFGPRVGFAYSLPGISNTVVRGGYGLFYQRDTDNAFVDLSLNPPFIYYTFRPFNQSNINEFNWFDPTAGGSNNALGYYCMNPYMKTPRTQQWNLSLEHTHWGALFSLGYVGSFSYHMTNLEYPNQARPGPGDIASRRRWPDWFFYWQNWNGVGNYHGLQLKFQKPFAHGFTLLSGFTWSKTMDDVGGNFVGEGERSSALQDNDNRRADYGLAAQDVPKRFVVAYLYELPVGRGKRFLSKGGAASAVLGGWQLNGVTTVQSGNPVFVSQACNRANTDAGTMRPDLVHNPNLPGGRSHGEQVAEWFDTSAFVNVCPGPEGPFSFGNAGRNIVRGPGLHDWDFGLAKQIPLPGEGRHLDFRAEFFNIFNHPIFGQPGGTAGTPQFGVISGTVVNPREIQFALKLYF